MSQLLDRAMQYCQDKQIRLILEDALGSGTDGTVWQTDATTAVKACERSKNYELELECYRRFKELNVRKIWRLALPELRGHSDDLQVIEMSIVRPPYLLDFGKVYLDHPPPYFEDYEVIANWRAECEELFEGRWPEVNHILSELQKYGIYYVDPKPANIRL